MSKPKIDEFHHNQACTDKVKDTKKLKAKRGTTFFLKGSNFEKPPGSEPYDVKLAGWRCQSKRCHKKVLTAEATWLAIDKVKVVINSDVTDTPTAKACADGMSCKSRAKKGEHNAGGDSTLTVTANNGPGNSHSQDTSSVIFPP